MVSSTVVTGWHFLRSTEWPYWTISRIMDGQTL
jgi:hypothetical protein